MCKKTYDDGHQCRRMNHISNNKCEKCAAPKPREKSLLRECCICKKHIWVDKLLNKPFERYACANCNLS